MGTPTIPQKRLLAAGAIRSTQSWGTAEKVTGALNGMLIKEDGGLKRVQPYQPAMEADTPFVLEGDLGNIDPVDFAIGFTMRHDPGPIGMLIAQLFGEANTPPPAGQPDPMFLHFFQWTDENYGEFATFAIERVGEIYEVPSAKVYSLDFSVADGFIEGTLGLRGNTVIFDSLVTRPEDMDAITYKDRGNRAKFSPVVVMMNTQADGALATPLEVSDFSIHYERPHDSMYGAGSPSIIEPMETGPSIITATLNFPRMNNVNSAYFASFIDEVEQKMLIRMMGSGPVGGPYYFWEWNFPRMRIIDIDYPFDDIVPATITLQAEESVGALPAGMAYKRPYVRLTTKRSTHYLT